MASKPDIRIRRVYDPPADDDGARILVDRLWPRGVKKEAAALTLWLKDVAPSDELRKWFGHEPARWPEFARRYRAELDRNGPAVEQLRALADRGRVTLLFGAHDRERNQAVALMDYLHDHIRAAPRRKTKGSAAP